jgi:hypothetical protein
MNCRFCNSSNVINEFNEGKQQYGTKCLDCNKYTWQPKIDNKYKRQSKHTDLVNKKDLDYCQWCLRNKTEIPPPGTLEAHHILEYSEGGTNELDNILILCSSCHKQCHHDRTYFGHYKTKKA